MNSHWFLSASLLAVPLLALLPRPAAAQIYAWRDAGGTLVLSDRPTSPDAVTFVARRPDTSRIVTPVFAPEAGLYDNLIDQHAVLYGVRRDLVRAVIQVESGFNPRARSPRGALGLMQLMPDTASEFGVRDAFDPADNIRGGVAYLGQLLTRYEGNEELALAAYNAGPRAVERHGYQVPLYQETRRYVRLIKTASGLFAAADTRAVMYETTDVVEGRVIPRYSNVKSAGEAYRVLEVRR